MRKALTKSKSPAGIAAPMRPTATPPATSLLLPREVRTTLRRVGARQFRVKVTEGMLWLTAALPTLALGQALADWAFNLPWLVRALLLLGDAAVVVYLSYTFLFVPWQRRLTSRTAALLIEREVPEFRSALISAVELAASRKGQPHGSPALVRALIAQVSTQVRKQDLARRVVKSSHLKRRVLWATLALALAIGAAASFSDTARLLASRILLFHVPLPTSTIVIPITRHGTVAHGEDFTLSARAQGVVPKSGRVLIVYANGKRAELSVSPQSDDARVFTLTLSNVQQSFIYHFALNDGVDDDYPVEAVVPPALESCHFLQKYPDYTGMKATEMSAGNLSLLAGSRMHIEGKATQSLQAITLRLEGVNQSVAMETTGADHRSFKGEFAVPKAGLTGFSIGLTNARGVSSKENTVYRVDLITDKPPEVHLSSPRSARLAVVLSSKPGLAFSARDDFGLRRIALRYEVNWPAPPGGEPPPPQNSEIPLPTLPDTSSSIQTFVWDLSKLMPPPVIGCTLRYWIEATDNNNVTGPGVGQSEKKTLAVLSEEDMRAELTEILGNKAKDIDAIYSNQKKLNEDVDATAHNDHP